MRMVILKSKDESFCSKHPCQLLDKVNEISQSFSPHSSSSILIVHHFQQFNDSRAKYLYLLKPTWLCSCFVSKYLKMNSEISLQPYLIISRHPQHLSIHLEWSRITSASIIINFRWFTMSLSRALSFKWCHILIWIGTPIRAVNTNYFQVYDWISNWV